MPKINVYVPDDLKRRMDAVRIREKEGAFSGWSLIAQNAFSKYCAKIEGPDKFKEEGPPNADEVVQTLSHIIKDYRNRLKEYNAVDERGLAAPAPKLQYITRIPRQPLPEGTVLVHNHVVPQRRFGLNGFRAWTQAENDQVEVCHCDWAGVDLHGLAHYRVKARPTAGLNRK